MIKEIHTNKNAYLKKIKRLAKAYDQAFIVQSGNWYKVVYPNGEMVDLPYRSDVRLLGEETLKFKPKPSATAHLEFIDYTDERFFLPMRIETTSGIGVTVGNDYIKPDTPVEIRVTRPQDVTSHFETMEFRDLRYELVDELDFIVNGQLDLNTEDSVEPPRDMVALMTTYAMVLSRSEFLKTSVDDGIDLNELA